VLLLDRDDLVRADTRWGRWGRPRQRARREPVDGGCYLRPVRPSKCCPRTSSRASLSRQPNGRTRK